MNINNRTFQNSGQCVWLHDISRQLLINGLLKSCISDFSVTGLTTSPTTFEKAISDDSEYDEAIRKLVVCDYAGEGLFFELALEDLALAADMFRPIFDASGGVDGWVSLAISPLLANDTTNTIKAATQLHARASLRNLFISIPGTPAGIAAIEQCIFDGIPINVTLLFSSAHYVAAANAYLRGLERRLEAGLDLRIESVASVFVSRWDQAVKEEISPQFHNRLGIATAMQTYKAYRDFLASERWQAVFVAGARPQRLLWVIAGNNDSVESDTLYLEALAANDTIIAIPETALIAYGERSKFVAILPADGGFSETVIEEFRREGVDDYALATSLQREGVAAFTKSWLALMLRIREKCS